jgi:hypothetical protein
MKLRRNQVVVGIASLFFCGALFAKTNVVLEPKHPVNCAINYEGLADWINDVQLEEQGAQFTVSISISAGACQNHTLVPTFINADLVSVSIFNNNNSNYVPTISYIQHSDVEVIISLSFNKSSIFEHQNESSFSFTFSPKYNYEKSRPSIWKLTAVLDPNTNNIGIAIK